MTLVHRSEHDGLFTQLRRYFPQLLVALGLLLVLGLWHAGQRFGPILPAASPARRQLQEHLHGSAEFLMRHGNQARLLQQLQQDIRCRASRHHPGFEQLSAGAQLPLLARLTNLPPGRVEQAMRPVPAQRLSAIEFTRRSPTCKASGMRYERTDPRFEQPRPDHQPHQPARARAAQLAQALRDELHKAVIGGDEVIDGVLTALIAGGHVLIEGVPGLGKTLLVRALARCFGGEFSRIQFTPDLMPSDVTGHAVYDMQSEQFKLRRGRYSPICCWPTRSTAHQPRLRRHCSK